jgi:hypothetical protein
MMPTRGPQPAMSKAIPIQSKRDQRSRVGCSDGFILRLGPEYTPFVELGRHVRVGRRLTGN